MNLDQIHLPTQTKVFGRKELFHYGQPGSDACATIAVMENLLATDPPQRFLACVESCILAHTLYHEVCAGDTAEKALNDCVERWERYVTGRLKRTPSRA